MSISDITLSKVLIINKDEKYKEYKNIEKDIETHPYDKYNIIIVCTQDSLSGSKTHFQTTFKKFIEEKDFTIILVLYTSDKKKNHVQLPHLPRFHVSWKIFKHIFIS